jgi:hypothetical protein
MKIEFIMTLTYGQELKVIVSGYYTGGYILNMVQIRVEFVISMRSVRMMHDGVTAGLNLYHHLGLCDFTERGDDRFVRRGYWYACGKSV